VLRRLLIVLGVLAGLLALADRGLAVLAGNAVEEAVRRSERLDADPEVTFEGFPFLTQAVRGRFEKVRITVRGAEVEGLRLDEVEATLRDVEIAVGDVLSGEVSAVPVGSGSALVTVRYADLNDQLAGRPGTPRVSAGANADAVTVTGTVPNVGEVTATAVPMVRDGVLRVDVRDVRRAGGGALPPAVQAVARQRLSFTIGVGALPFGVTLEPRVGVGADGLSLAGSVSGVVLRVRS
jgi:hypothetical protein